MDVCVCLDSIELTAMLGSDQSAVHNFPDDGDDGDGNGGDDYSLLLLLLLLIQRNPPTLFQCMEGTTHGVS